MIYLKKETLLINEELAREIGKHFLEFQDENQVSVRELIRTLDWYLETLGLIQVSQSILRGFNQEISEQ